jgi:hypothetical protein
MFLEKYHKFNGADVVKSSNGMERFHLENPKRPLIIRYCIFADSMHRNSLDSLWVYFNNCDGDV